jgi:hypothetical protein
MRGWLGRRAGKALLPSWNYDTVEPKQPVEG